ncbi:hypothetical protein ACMA1I_01575 [Pontibacter sp. 13R65]|uniref:hypothetical protein n=1 Tax=Pontibacter sp. 13R65 TaxID=3127458 RepID=UPI00301E2566
MKTYKVLKTADAEAFETNLNELAKVGWKVVNANLAFAGDADNTTIYFALLENAPIDDELKQLIEENTDEIESLGLSPSAN